MFRKPMFRTWAGLCLTLTVLVVCNWSRIALAFIGVAQAVGGVHIDPNGVVVNVLPADMEAMRNAIQANLENIPGNVNEANELRKVSLKRLDKAVAEHLASGKPLADEIRFMAGLQSIKYILVYPEQQDIVLVGYGEGWVLDKQGYIVGRTTKKPVLLLDDFTVALRAARQSMRGGGISCSIDPTESGLKALREYAAKLTEIGQLSTEQVEQTLGMQNISVSGVPANSHFARVLVAADYRMKRIGMNLDKSQVVPGLPSYIDLLSGGGRGMQSMTPRWWLVPNYPAILADPNGLAWELRGCSVKTMTEETFFNPDGGKKQTGQSSPAAQQWANKMTEKFDKLAEKQPVFGQLKNCMDLAVVTALIVKHDLAAKAGLSLFSTADPMHLVNQSLETPRMVPTQAGVTQKGSSFIVSASGGVEIRTADSLNRVETTEKLTPIRQTLKTPEPSHWWWN
ncbi:MAG: DUF1598 domain-containing protein [Planctomycetes bacterium]|nr:DUF1598 domain-containing protein [Planctomycetota bacterium]